VPLRGAGREPDMKTNQRRRVSQGSLGNVYHCGLILHYKTKCFLLFRLWFINRTSILDCLSGLSRIDGQQGHGSRICIRDLVRQVLLVTRSVSRNVTKQPK
jgi:hypothetical protein